MSVAVRKLKGLIEKHSSPRRPNRELLAWALAELRDMPTNEGRAAYARAVEHVRQKLAPADAERLIGAA